MRAVHFAQRGIPLRDRIRDNRRGGSSQRSRCCRGSAAAHSHAAGTGCPASLFLGLSLAAALPYASSSSTARLPPSRGSGAMVFFLFSCGLMGESIRLFYEFFYA